MTGPPAEGTGARVCRPRVPRCNGKVPVMRAAPQERTGVDRGENNEFPVHLADCSCRGRQRSRPAGSDSGVGPIQ